MKRLLILISCLFFLCSNLKAVHTAGGEITWECDSLGRYIFKMVLYRDCSGAPLYYGNQNLQLIGNPLPKDLNNNTISNIHLYPDSILGLRTNSVYLEQNCNSTSSNTNYSCANGDFGVLQAYYYKSHPVYFQGLTSQNGLRIAWAGPCCRPQTRNNIISSGSPLLQAIMFPSSSNYGPCIDNSPKFSENPSYTFCRGLYVKNSYSAIDIDGDSLVYQLAPSYNTPPSNPVSIAYANGYSWQSPTPNSSFDSSNIASSIDPLTGILSFKVNNGVGQGLGSYFIVVEVRSYRNGQGNAIVRREMPVYLFDCPALSNQTINQAPSITPPFLKNGSPSFKDTVLVGNLISARIQVEDTNLSSGIGQEVSLQISSDQITKDYSFNGDCYLNSDTNCAYIVSINNKVYDSLFQTYEFVNQRMVNGILRWQPDCSDLGSNGEAKTHFFVIKAQDDHCPTPAVRYEVIEITVVPDPNNPCGTITSINDDELLNERISIFPNPTSGLVNLKLTQNEQLEINVRNMQGKLVNQFKLNEKRNYKFEIEGPAGIYFLEISNSEGEKMFKKVVKY